MVFLKSIISAVLYQPLLNALIFLVWLIPDHNVGWAIIILTVIIRIILLPSSMNATRQQKKMRDLQPEISELQSKYKDDKQKQSQELMKFYKEKKINPLGSCLPLLVQMPILIILYYVFRNGLDTSRFSLLYSFVPQPEYIKTVFLGIDLAKPEKEVPSLNKQSRFQLPLSAAMWMYVGATFLTSAKSAFAIVAPSGHL